LNTELEKIPKEFRQLKANIVVKIDDDPAKVYKK